MHRTGNRQLGRGIGSCVRRRLRRRPTAWIVVAALAFFGWGCGKDDAHVPYENTRTQLERDLFDSLARGESRQAIREIDRLKTVSKPARFYERAEHHERLRLAMFDIQRQVYEGELDAAVQQSRRLARENPSHAEVKRLFVRCKALDALRKAVGRLPRPWAAEQQEVLEAVRPHLEVLSVSSVFRDWFQAQREELRRLAAAERAEAVRQLSSELDRSVVSIPRAAPLVLAQLAEVHPPVEDRLAHRSQGSAMSALPAASSLPLESAISLLGGRNTACQFASKAAHVDSVWSCEILADILVEGAAQRWQRVFAGLRELHRKMAVDQSYIEMIAAAYLPPSRPSDEVPWVPPCPSVSLVLLRIVDIVEASKPIAERAQSDR